MKTFRQFLNEKIEFLSEGFVNLIGDDEKKAEYVDAVWEMLQTSYAKIGGMKGSGFENKESMIKNIPFWKVATVSGKPVAVIMYKDKGGRKSVAMGTDGSKTGKTKVIDMAKNEITRAFGEKSKGSLAFL